MPDPSRYADDPAPLSWHVRQALIDAWEDGNCTGLDGWAGEDSGSEPDRQAIEARDRKVATLVNKLYPDDNGGAA
jgi:hypothetical protein